MLTFAIEDPKMIPNVIESIKMFPVYDVKISINTEGFEEILCGDIVTITIVLTRNNLPEDKEIGFGHCNENIDLYHDNAAVFLTNNEIISFQDIVRYFIIIRFH